MKVLYFEETRKPDLEKDTGAKRVGLNELLKKSDSSPACAADLEDPRLIGTKQFAMMKPTAILVKHGARPGIDEDALVNGAEERHHRRGGARRLRAEPKIHPRLMKLKNVVLLPQHRAARRRGEDETWR